MYIASGFYPWGEMYKAVDRKPDLHEIAATCAVAGYDGFEPIAVTADELEPIAAAVTGAGLAMRSLYVNASLHDSAGAGSEIERCASIASLGREAGLEWLVVNPVPLDWNTSDNKSDDQLSVQLDSLRSLGSRLRSAGVGLAYHTHASEMRASARELHHMLLNTTNEDMTWCLDGDWVYRGAEMSTHIVYDFTRLYAGRVSIVHVRQSIGGVWTDAAGPGDLDYARIADLIGGAGGSPLLVAEQIPNDPGAAFENRAVDAAESRDAIESWFSR